MKSFTIAELEQASGFDRRTIAYYIQEGLLPKVGRRGARTRYPQPFLQRLLFIRAVRTLQDSGKLRAVTLSEIRHVMDGMDDASIGRHGNSGKPTSKTTTAIRALFMEPERRQRHLATPGKPTRNRIVASFMDEEPTVHETLSDWLFTDISEVPHQFDEPVSSSYQTRSDHDDRLVLRSVRQIRDLIRDMEDVAAAGVSGSTTGTVDTRFDAVITDHVCLSIRGLGETDLQTMRQLAALLRQLLVDDDDA